MLDNLPEWLKYLSVFFLIVASYIVTGRWLAKALYSIAGETETIYDDIVVKRLKPRRVALTRTSHCYLPLCLSYPLS